ncbi:MAG: hypothetical protein HKN80_00785 [Acidimicrobiia bacterium]|nr:hypothetical protein [Acidimicrobiia bacterium]
MRRIILLSVAALLVVALAVPAIAAPSNKGTTYVTPSDVTLSVLQGVTAPASLDEVDEVLVAGFGITGKPAAKGFNDGVIKHVGGLEIASQLGVIEIRNFWIDTVAGTVSAEVADLGRFDLFNLADVATDVGDCEVTATLEFNEFASDAIVGTDISIEGLPAGTACVDLG